MAKLNENIFRPNDIRGIYGKDLTEEIAEKIGKAFGTMLGERKRVVVGRDVRLSSKSLRDSLVKGLVSTGCNVVDIGVVTTPAFYFALYFHKFDGGIMITASHNPPEWNGFHIYKGMKSLIAEEKIEKLKRIIEKEKFREAKVKGKVKKYGKILHEYMDFLFSKVKIKRKLKIVVDCSNGCAALIVPKLLKKLGQEVVVLNDKIDGNFPAHGPGVEEENLKELIREVKRSEADFGVAYDGDADRAVFVDDKGRVVLGDKTALVILEEIFKKKKSPKILNEVSCSSAVEEYIRSKSAVLITNKRGHAFIQEKMREKKIDFGFEKSSHFYFSEIKGFDDAALATLKVAETLSRSGRKFSQIVDSIVWYPSKEEAFPCKDEIKLKVVENIKKEILKLGLKTSELDGIKAYTDQGWFLIRASITEPVVRITAEAKDEKSLEKILNLARNLLKKEINICSAKVK
ncbi:MAG: phosphomannomutase/phosphoglucomutase [Candidatus Aenigmatarchaeota archaeon]